MRCSTIHKRLLSLAAVCSLALPAAAQDQEERALDLQPPRRVAPRPALQAGQGGVDAFQHLCRSPRHQRHMRQGRLVIEPNLRRRLVVRRRNLVGDVGVQKRVVFVVAERRVRLE